MDPRNSALRIRTDSCTSRSTQGTRWIIQEGTRRRRRARRIRRQLVGRHRTLRRTYHDRPSRTKGLATNHASKCCTTFIPRSDPQQAGRSHGTNLRIPQHSATPGLGQQPEETAIYQEGIQVLHQGGSNVPKKWRTTPYQVHLPPQETTGFTGGSP